VIWNEGAKKLTPTGLIGIDRGLPFEPIGNG
jgi:hypothetical protein